ncbi:MAG: hypothetical protein AB1798_13440 [Spirochaetota bacterium]
MRKLRISKLFRKNLLIIVGLFGIVGIITTIFSGWSLNKHITNEYKSKGMAIANAIAHSSVEIVLNRDASTIQSIIDQFIEIEGVSFVFVIDSEGEIISHTFVPTVPEEALTLIR